MIFICSWRTYIVNLIKHIFPINDYLYSQTSPSQFCIHWYSCAQEDRWWVRNRIKPSAAIFFLNNCEYPYYFPRLSLKTRLAMITTRARRKYPRRSQTHRQTCSGVDSDYRTSSSRSSGVHTSSPGSTGKLLVRIHTEYGKTELPRDVLARGPSWLCPPDHGGS